MESGLITEEFFRTRRDDKKYLNLNSNYLVFIEAGRLGRISILWISASMVAMPWGFDVSLLKNCVIQEIFRLKTNKLKLPRKIPNLADLMMQEALLRLACPDSREQNG
jgi:hypothetical protein